MFSGEEEEGIMTPLNENLSVPLSNFEETFTNDISLPKENTYIKI